MASYQTPEEAKQAWRTLVADKTQMGQRTLANPAGAKADHNQFQDDLADTIFAPSLKFTDVKTAAYQAVAGDLVQVDATSGTIPITMPASPAKDDLVGVKLVAGQLTTIDGGSNTVESPYYLPGQVAVRTLFGQDSVCIWQFSDGTWHVVQDAKPGTWVELWQGTAIDPIPVTATGIEFTQVELFPGQPSLFTHGFGNFQALEESAWRMGLTGELNFNASANNVDATAEINPISGASSIRAIGDIVESYQSSRSGIFRKGITQTGLVSFNQNDIFSITAQEVDSSGAMDVSLVELWVIFELFT